ncbi:M28 family peptidase [Hyphomonadaceae bacterium BL14]|nr:M28 family peptidase [Hyphomonadaceae bacterium BL14]
MLTNRLFFAAASAALLLGACGPQASQDTAPAEMAAAAGTCDSVEAQPLRDVCILAADNMAGRMVGSEGGARARAYVLSRFEEIGLAPAEGGYEQAFAVARPLDLRERDSLTMDIPGINLIGVIQGEDPSIAMVVTAHYDHIGMNEQGEIFNGADDNASGVGGLLAVAAHFLANPPRHNVVIVALDAEEGGLDGARHFVANRPVGMGEIAFNLNLDMLGYSDTGRLFAVGSYHTPELVGLIEAAASESPVELLAGYDRPTENRRDDWTLLSDHAAFHLQGIPFLYLGVEDHPYYHTVNDTFDIIMPDFYLGAVETAVDVAARADAMLPELAAIHRARAEPAN